MSDTEPRCSVTVKSDHTGFHFRSCGNKIKAVRGGVGYCGVHDPVARAARRRDRGPTLWEREQAELKALRDKIKSLKARIKELEDNE